MATCLNSDMDTIPVKHYVNWSAGAVPFLDQTTQAESSSRAALVSRVKESQGRGMADSGASQSVRAVISIEGRPDWFSVGGL